MRLGYLGLFKEAWICVRIQRIASDIGTKLLQPKAHPAAFETGMACQKNPATVPECGSYAQSFQGASPLFHMASSVMRSRKVSMGCQNPLCS